MQLVILSLFICLFISETLCNTGTRRFFVQLLHVSVLFLTRNVTQDSRLFVASERNNLKTKCGPCLFVNFVASIEKIESIEKK